MSRLLARQAGTECYRLKLLGQENIILSNEA